MIKHIVMWKLKDENKKENLKRIKTELEALKGKIEGLREAFVGLDFGVEGNYDAVLVADFENLKAFKEYQIHPEHVKIAEFIKNIRVARTSVDYEY